MSIQPNYLPIESLLNLIDPTARDSCMSMLDDNRFLFENARGSTNNHQTWEGGYIDHITDCINYARHFYNLLSIIGRPLPFTLSDVTLILFLHDLEKPWRIQINSHGIAKNRKGLDTKSAFKEFRENKLIEYGLHLNTMQQNALTYVEGELADYSSKERIMNELAAFCHMIDVWSARGAYNFPKQNDDLWTGAD